MPGEEGVSTVMDETVNESCPSRRHLMFHVYPAASNVVWRRAVDQLRMRLHLFDGVKVCGVATGEGTMPFQDVVDAFAGTGMTLFEVHNNRNLREVSTWHGLVNKVFESAEPNDAVFYCHAKGVTHPCNPGVTVHSWTSMMFSLLLDYWPEVEPHLKRYGIVGAFKKTGIPFGTDFGRWHYSGAFYWLRIDEFKRRLERTPMPRIWHGIESWPGMAWDVPESSTLFINRVVSKLDIYRQDMWPGIMQEYGQWLRAKPKRNPV